MHSKKEPLQKPTWAALTLEGQDYGNAEGILLLLTSSGMCFTILLRDLSTRPWEASYQVH